MTTEATGAWPSATTHPVGAPLRRWLSTGVTLPVVTLLAAITVLWYVAAIGMNWSAATDALDRAGDAHTTLDALQATLQLDRPLLPAPHQILQQLIHDTLELPMTSRRSLVFHAGVTLEATLVGFVLGAVFGVTIAIAIVHLRSVEQGLMPWIVASQSVPVLALAPMVIVALGAVGLSGLLPKAIIAAYLSFFPVVVGMVKGFKSPDAMTRDLMRTYAASRLAVLLKLRLPSALPFLFVSSKVAISASLVGTIVAELPTGAEAGIGARLLMGSYYGQTVQIWAALVMAGLLATILVQAVSLAEWLALSAAGARPKRNWSA